MNSSKRHYVFISYTTREEEYEQVRDFSKVVVDELIRRGLKEDIATYVWLDMFEMFDRRPSAEEIEEILRRGVGASAKFLAFVSPQYNESAWCNLEYRCAQENRMPIGSIVWKGPDHIHDWWRYTANLDARPFFQAERLTDPLADIPIWKRPWRDDQSWKTRALRGFQDRLYEYLLFRSFVDSIYNFIVDERVFSIPPAASILWDRLR